MDGFIEKQIEDGQRNILIDRVWIEKEINRQMDGQRNRFIDRWIDKQMDGQRNRLIDGRITSSKQKKQIRDELIGREID